MRPDPSLLGNHLARQQPELVLGQRGRDQRKDSALLLDASVQLEEVPRDLDEHAVLVVARAPVEKLVEGAIEVVVFVRSREGELLEHAATSTQRRVKHPLLGGGMDTHDGDEQGSNMSCFHGSSVVARKQHEMVEQVGHLIVFAVDQLDNRHVMTAGFIIR